MEINKYEVKKTIRQNNSMNRELLIIGTYISGGNKSKEEMEMSLSNKTEEGEEILKGKRARKRG